MNGELAAIDISFHEQFGTEEACAKYLFQVKWPDGFSCPRCSHRHAYEIRTRRLPLYECRHCRYQSSLTAGTVMEGSRTELYKWFTAFFLISRVDSGVSATELSQAIRVTYKTAWLILHKIRHAMTLANQQTLLSGIVQVNAAAYGKPYNPTIHLHKQEQPLLVGAAMDDYGHPACFKIKLVPHSHMYQRVISAEGSKAFMEQYIEPCTSNVEIVIGRFSPKRFKMLLAFVNDASKWINATFHGLGRKHLQAYLDEFTYRRNLTIREEPILFHLLRQCITSFSVTYANLVGIRTGM